MDPLRLVTRSFSLSREIATRKIIKQFARKHELVYFGYVNQRDDANELIRGITVSTSHIDKHFCVGSYQGHDISVVERSNTIAFSDKASREYRWLIMQVDLHKGGVPHMFIDANHHDQQFYETLFMRFANFTNAAPLFTERDPSFARSFRTFVAADKFDHAAVVMQPAITHELTKQYRQFDYETDDDRLLVYANDPLVSPRVLQEMLAAGTWFAGQLDVASRHDVPLVQNGKNR
mgnify:CR=1 FL=1